MLITDCFCDLFISWETLHDEGKRDVIVPGKLWNSSYY